MKKIGLCFFCTMLLILILPGCISLFFGTDAVYRLTEPIHSSVLPQAPEAAPVSADVSGGAVTPPVLESGALSLEDYLCGVLAAEVSPDYAPEALKAQAVAARTYACRHLDILPSQNPMLTAQDIDDIQQAYLSPAQQKERWGARYEENAAKMSAAVAATAGEILVYDNIPIEAVFHSTSAGMTEAAENVWNQEYPYLKSVSSAGDLLSPEYTAETRFENDALLRLLESRFPGLILTDAPFLEQFKLLARSDAGYVERAQLGDSILTGRQIREALGLKSAAFTVTQQADAVVFTTKGYGHGVGMSQNGANQMAEEGADYVDILSHYYTGAAILPQ